MSQNLLYAGVVIDALRVKDVSLHVYTISCSLVFCKEPFMPSQTLNKVTNILESLLGAACEKQKIKRPDNFYE